MPQDIGRPDILADVTTIDAWKQTPHAKEKEAWQTRIYVATQLTPTEEDVYTREAPYIHITPPTPHDAVLIGTGFYDERYWGIFALPAILRSHLSSRFEDIDNRFTMRLVFHRMRAEKGYGVTLPFSIPEGIGFMRTINSDTTRDATLEGVMEQLSAQDNAFSEVIAPRRRPKRISVRATSNIDKFTVQMAQYVLPYPQNSASRF